MPKEKTKYAKDKERGFQKLMDKLAKAEESKRDAKEPADAPKSPPGIPPLTPP